MMMSPIQSVAAPDQMSHLRYVFFLENRFFVFHALSLSLSLSYLSIYLFIFYFFSPHTQNLRPRYHAMCTNASWSLGEIAVKVGPEMRPFVPPAVDALARILFHESQVRNAVK